MTVTSSVDVCQVDELAVAFELAGKAFGAFQDDLHYFRKITGL